MDVRTNKVVRRELESSNRRRLEETPRGEEGNKLPDSTTIIRRRLLIGAQEVLEKP